ncbi:hypothetical protein HAX54_015117, partial [Datura stramonium]|nr:hypothetical protein [Datura stramonium]
FLLFPAIASSLPHYFNNSFLATTALPPRLVRAAQVAILSFLERVDAFPLDSSRLKVDISNIILLLVMAVENDFPCFLGLTLVGWDVLSRLQLFLWVRQLP